MDVKQLHIAPCGLDCARCDLRSLIDDAGAAQRTVEWFLDMNWLKAGEGIAEIIERKMYCTGCRGDRSVHWSPDCNLFTCCVDERGLQYCSQCSDFPCGPLSDWAADDEGHTQALQRLEGMKARGL